MRDVHYYFNQYSYWTFFLYPQEFSLAEGYRFHVRDVIWYGTNTLNLRLRSCIQGSLHNHIYDILQTLDELLDYISHIYYFPKYTQFP